MNKQKGDHTLPIRLVKLLNWILMTVSFMGAWFEYYAARAEVHYYNRGNWLLFFIFAALYFYFCRIYDAFHVSTSSISEIVYSQTLALLFTNLILYVVICLLSSTLSNPLPLLLSFVIEVIISAIWTVCAHKWYFHKYGARTAVIVYDTREGLEHVIKQHGLEKKFNVTKIMQVQECLDNLPELNNYETVFLSGIHSHERNIILKHCMYDSVPIYVIPRIGDVIMGGAEQMHMLHLPIMALGRYNPTPEYAIAKRAFDIILSALGIVVLSPALLIITIAVKSDGGPALYKQTRLTKDGKEFQVLKFRSMRVDAEKDGVARLSTGDIDPRITKVGRVIRKIRADEFPQLFNILKGDMSIVGPRPERPEIAAQYEEDLPEFKLRLQMKAGLTGYAQIYGKYNTTPYDKLLLDLMYINHPTIWQDLKICFATVKVLFLPESTEGVQEGATTAALDTQSEGL